MEEKHHTKILNDLSIIRFISNLSIANVFEHFSAKNIAFVPSQVLSFEAFDDVLK